MKKIFAAFIGFILSMMMISSSMPSSAAKKALDQSDFVHAHGSCVIGTDGKKLLIKGMALGNSVYANPAVPNLRHHTQEAYKELSELGFNSVRFYINYGLFEDDRTPYKYKQSGFDWLDKNIKWAKKYNMGIILNMHCPQGGYQSSGGGMALWTDKNNQKRLTALWKEIAKRYADEPTVWGYGLINEPYVPMLDTMEETAKQYFDYAESLVKEIRSISPYQAIFVERLGNAKDTAGNRSTDWEWFTPQNTFPKIDDDNIIYEFHCYDPFHFTHQNAEWAGTSGITMSYPSDEVTEADYENGWVSCVSADPVKTENSWTYFESKPQTVTSRYNIVFPALSARKTDTGGTAYFDDITVTLTSPNGTETVLCSYDFETGTAGMSKWSADGTGSMSVSENGRNGGKCAVISGTDTAVTLSGKHFAMKKGYSYRVSGYAKSENVSCAPEIRLDFAKASDFSTFNKDYLDSVIKPYADYSEKYNVPLYMGEFGVISEGFKEGRNGTEWVSDMIEICTEYRIGFNYHTYHETSFGYYGNTDTELPSHKNKALGELFKKALKSEEEH